MVRKDSEACISRKLGLKSFEPNGENSYFVWP